MRPPRVLVTMRETDAHWLVRYLRGRELNAHAPSERIVAELRHALADCDCAHCEAPREGATPS
jgi:hypothetical protein